VKKDLSSELSKARELLLNLEERHPIDDWRPGAVTLLCAGHGMGQAMPMRKTIVLPRDMLEVPLVARFAIIHEYGHIYREHMLKDKWYMFWRMWHDKRFRRLEDEWLAEYGIRMKRWLIYPREISSVDGERFIPLEHVTARDAIMGGISNNVWGLFIAWIIAANLFPNTPPETYTASLYFLVGLWLVSHIEGTLAPMVVQNIAWARHWWSKRRALVAEPGAVR
jgi:hypothetical protein